MKGFAAKLPPPIREMIARDPDVLFISRDGDAEAIAATEPVATNETLPTELRGGAVDDGRDTHG